MITPSVALCFISDAVAVNAPHIFWNFSVREIADQAMNDPLPKEFLGFVPRDDPLSVAK
jgi:hypothetical protein